MIMTDYTEFDKALLAEIARAPQNLTRLMGNRPLCELAKSLGLIDYLGNRASMYRIFDRRLQALRRAGKIRYTGRVWEAING
jgi:hypothetical protein